MKQAIGNVIIGALFGFLLVFIGVNLMTGCEDWSQPNCVTPWQLIGMEK